MLNTVTNAYMTDTMLSVVIGAGEWGCCINEVYYSALDRLMDLTSENLG